MRVTLVRNTYTFLFFSTLTLSSFATFSQSSYTSAGSGNWNTQNNWTPAVAGGPGPNDHVTILSIHTITTNSLTRTGNTTVNGRLDASGKVTFNGNGQTIGGTGIISGQDVIELTTGPKTIPSSASLTLSVVSVNIIGGITISNNGTVTIASGLIGSVAGSTWTNNASSTLNISGALLSVGTLNAFAAGNTVNYYGTTAQSIKLPALSGGHFTYYNLTASGSNNKTILDAAGATNLAINGDLTIYSTLNGNGGNKIVRVRGNWLNYGNFTEGAGTVIFDGTVDQSIIKSAGDESFNHLTINKSSGKIILNTNVTVGTSVDASADKSILTMTSGNIECGAFKLSLGRYDAQVPDLFTGILVWTSGTIVGEFERYIDNNWDNTRTYVLNELVFYNGGWWKSKTIANLNNAPAENANWTASSVLFPIGTSTSHRPADVIFNNVTPGSLIAKFHSSPVPGNNGMPLSESGVTLYNTFRDGYWSLITANSLTSSDYNLDLTGNGFSGFTISANTRLLTRSNSSSPWTLNGTHGVLAGNTVKRQNISTISAEYCFGDDTNCLAPTDPVISGTNDVCQNTTGWIYSVPNTGNSFLWNVIGGSITSGQGTNQIVVSWGTGQSGSVSVVETNACTSSSEVILSVTVNPVPPASITGKTSVPQNGVTPIAYSTPTQAGYTHTWAVTGGSIVTGQNTNAITVSWGATGTGTVCVTSTNACGTSGSTCISVNKYIYISSARTGNWGTANTWDCNCTPTQSDNVVILTTHTVTTNSTTSSAKNLTINAGGALNNSNVSRTVNVYGDLTVNGNGTAGAGAIIGAGIISLIGSGSILDGVGSINNTGFLNFNANSSVFSTAIITRTTGQVRIGSDAEITNNGSLTLGGNLTETDGTSVWTNDTGSSLTIAGSLLTGAGILNASATGNTVHYNGALAQIIKTPASNYYAISFSGAGEKTAPTGLLFIAGNFTNNGSATTGSWIGFNPNGGSINFNGTSSILGTSVSSLNNLIVSGTLTSSSGLINVAGDISNTGTFNHNSGTVQLNGSGNQVLSLNGADVYNLTVSKTGGNVSLSSALDLISVLTIQSNTDFQSNGNLTLVSSGDEPDVTARIASLPDAADVSGNVNIQRFISNEDRFYRYISSPLTSSTVSDWQDDFAITGNFIGKSTKDPFNNSNAICGTAIRPASPSLYNYDESIAGLVDEGYQTFPIMSTNLEVGRGYAAFIRESCYRNVMIDVTGLINKGDIPLPVTFTNTGDATADGWNLVGNPYPSAISWDSAAWTKTNISNVIAIRDNSGTGLLRYYDGSGGDFNGTIASGQAFWVQATGTGPSLIVREGAKTNSTGYSFYRVKTLKNEVPVIEISLNQNESNIEDKTFIKLREMTSFELDEWDASKLKNETVGISTLTPRGTAMAISAVPEISEGYIIPLKLEGVEDGNYELKFNSLGGFEQYSIELSDEYLGIKQVLNWGDTYAFKALGTEVSKNRFSAKLIQHQQSEIRVTKLIAYPNPLTDKLFVQLPPDGLPKYISIFDQRGLKLDGRMEGPEAQISEISFTSKPSGVYLIRLVGPGYNLITKVIKE